MSFKNTKNKATSHSKYTINYHIIFCPKYRYSIFEGFPNLKKSKFRGSGLWIRCYYVGTAGTVSAETIKRYIQNQKLVN